MSSDLKVMFYVLDCVYCLLKQMKSIIWYSYDLKVLQILSDFSFGFSLKANKEVQSKSINYDQLHEHSQVNIYNQFYLCLSNVFIDKFHGISISDKTAEVSSDETISIKFLSYVTGIKLSVLSICRSSKYIF